MFLVEPIYPSANFVESQTLRLKFKKQTTREDQERLLKKKATLLELIYNLIELICRENKENQVYAFALIDKFIKHIQYFPSSIRCISSIICANEILLTKIAESQRIEREGIDQMRFSSAKVDVDVLQHFMRAILVKKHDAHLIGFLRGICKFKDDGLTINQELLYRLLLNSSKDQDYYNATLFTFT